MKNSKSMRERVARTIAALVGAILLLAVAPLAAAQPVLLAPKVLMTPGQYAHVQSYASQGPEALRRYLWRTRMIHGWSWDDLVAPVPYRA